MCILNLNGKNQVALQLVAPLWVITILVTTFEALEHINLKNNHENRLTMALRGSPLYNCNRPDTHLIWWPRCIVCVEITLRKNYYVRRHGKVKLKNNYNKLTSPSLACLVWPIWGMNEWMKKDVEDCKCPIWKWVSEWATIIWSSDASASILGYWKDPPSVWPRIRRLTELSFLMLLWSNMQKYKKYFHPTFL